MTTYTTTDGGCDPAAHEVVKVNVGLNYKLSLCPSYLSSSPPLPTKYPACCLHPWVYGRYPKECDLLRSHTRSKRDDSESDLITQWIVEDEGVHEVPVDDRGEKEDDEDEIPKMEDAKIKVKCCGSNETTSCRGAECLYVCDDPASDTIGKHEI